MEAAQTFNQLCCVETCSSFAELLILTEMIEQLTAIQEVHHEIKFRWCLECIVQLNDERTVDFLQDVSFS